MELEKKNQFKLNYSKKNSIRNEEQGIIQKVSELLQDICDANKNETIEYDEFSELINFLIAEKGYKLP